MNELVSKEATDTIEAIKGTLAPVAVSLHAEADSFIEISQRLMNDTADRYGPEHVAFILLGMAGVRLALASGVDSITKQKEMRQLARRQRRTSSSGMPLRVVASTPGRPVVTASLNNAGGPARTSGGKNTDIPTRTTRARSRDPLPHRWHARAPKAHACPTRHS